MDADLELAHRLADIADAISLPRFKTSDLKVETKADLTPVTEADRSVEQAIRDHLASARPEDRVLGEEFGGAVSDSPPAGSGGARWIVDPIDGTKNYVRGIPVWATLIGVERDGVLVAGLASAPAMGHRWWAARGEGAFADGEPIRVSGVERLEEAQFCFGGLTTWAQFGYMEGFLELAGRCRRSRGFGDFWMHMLVAEGAADISAEAEVNLWDLAAVRVIVEEAGGRFTDLSGVATASGGTAMSSNGLLHDEALAILNRGRSGRS